MATENRSAPMVETISNEILCTMTGNITCSTFGHTFEVYTNTRSVYIADIKYTTVSSAAMFCSPVTRFYSQLFSGLIRSVRSRPLDSSRARTCECRFLCRVCELQRCKIS
ncbi:hypothetical protein CY34DRAFT_328016 [Suillus luteus UH-Slu-Lm8-n1]|uniref:Uncharacterized protein n=1 Tax=Suillus luteus UH-Slu-Lm8-n1 TaxID=930992 RepID=A0A0C9ZPG4_9AGAM|nr:hypothetical protein CY34DRAFT_328016 [Suillus luteus UH-Slu-Lm8-n1]